MTSNRPVLTDEQQAALDRLIIVHDEFEAVMEEKAELAARRAEAIEECVAKGITWSEMSRTLDRARVTLQIAARRGSDDG